MEPYKRSLELHQQNLPPGRNREFYFYNTPEGQKILAAYHFLHGLEKNIREHREHFRIWAKRVKRNSSPIYEVHLSYEDIFCTEKAYLYEEELLYLIKKLDLEIEGP